LPIERQRSFWRRLFDFATCRTSSSYRPMTKDHALLEIATSIEHNLLSTRFPHSDLTAIWRDYQPQERIQAFKMWLGHHINQPKLFIVDDLDGFKDESLIQAALPREAEVIIYSTRDPCWQSKLKLNRLPNLCNEHRGDNVSDGDIHA